MPTIGNNEEEETVLLPEEEPSEANPKETSPQSHPMFPGEHDTAESYEAQLENIMKNREKQLALSVQERTRYILTDVPLTIIRKGDVTERKHPHEFLKRLAHNIEQVGLEEYPLCKIDEDNELVLIYGNARIAATKLRGKQAIDVKTLFLNKSEVKEEFKLAYSESRFRRKFNAIERAEFYRDMIAKTSATIEEIADFVGEDRTTIISQLGLLLLHKGVQEYIRSGKIHWTKGRELRKITNLGDQLKLAQRAAKEKWTRTRLSEEIDRLLSSKKYCSGNQKPPDLPQKVSEQLQKSSPANYFGGEPEFVEKDYARKYIIDYLDSIGPCVQCEECAAKLQTDAYGNIQDNNATKCYTVLKAAKELGFNPKEIPGKGQKLIKYLQTRALEQRNYTHQEYAERLKELGFSKEELAILFAEADKVAQSFQKN